MADFRSLLAHDLSLVHWNYSINGDAMRTMRAQIKTNSSNRVNDDENAPMQWNTRIKVNISCDPFTNLSTKRPRDSSRMKGIYHEETGVMIDTKIEDLDNLQAKDVLDYFNSKHEKMYYGGKAKSKSFDIANDTGPIVFNSVAWFVIQLRSSIHEAQIVLLQQALQMVLDAIPVANRADFYSHSFVEICTLETDKSGQNMKPKKRASLLGIVKAYLDQQSRHDKVLLVALLHIEDHFLNEEKKLIGSDIFLSRAVINGNIELNLMNTGVELYEKSLQFVQYEAKLFGPQEEELGEDLANPLKFAKEMRGKKRALQHIMETMGTISQDGLQQHCRDHGIKDTGTKLELMDRLMEVLYRKIDLIGHSELSQFGKNLIQKMFHCMKRDITIDGKNDAPNAQHASSKHNEVGLTLWEFNKFLHKTNCQTLYDRNAYIELLNEHKLLVNRDQQLQLPGLFAFYEKEGHLANDMKQWSMGSLNDLLTGQFNMQIQFEPQAIQSIQQLLPDDPLLFVPKLFKFVTDVSIIKECKVEGELDNLTELIDLFPWDVLDFGDMKAKMVRLLKEPGLLATWLNELVSWCNHRTDGPLYSLRAYVAGHLTSTTGPNDIRDNGIAGDKSGQSRTAAEHQSSAAIDVDDLDLNDTPLHCFGEIFGNSFIEKVEKLFGEMRQVHEMNFQAEQAIATSGKSEVATLNQSRDPVNKLNESLANCDSASLASNDTAVATLQQRDNMPLSYSAYAQVVADILPTVPSQLRNKNLEQSKRDIVNDLVFLNNVRLMDGMSISLAESVAIDERKVYLEDLLAKIVDLQEEADVQLPVYILAAYDACRMFGKGICNLGVGSKDFCVQSVLAGVDFMEYLPVGMGEENHIQRLLAEKRQRFELRRQAALAAIERERLRRAMTEDDLDRIRQEKLRKERLIYESQDKLLFDEATRKLYESREERKTISELGQIVKLFDDFLKRKESRLPEGLDTLIAKNNLACALVELYSVDHLLCERKSRAISLHAASSQ